MAHLKGKRKKKGRTEVTAARAREPDFDVSRAKEIQSWKDTNAFQLVPNEGQQSVSSRWIHTLKDKEGKQIAKLRLVVRGFEDADRDKIQTATPTCMKTMWRFCIALAVTLKWTPRCIDIKTAFLQGKLLQRDVYVRLPKDQDPEGSTLWKLFKAV